MRRRDFVRGVIGSAIAWSFPARAQQTASDVPVVTLISARGADAGTELAAEFRKGLSQTGLTEGRDVVVEYHWLEGRYGDISAILSDAIRRHIAVITTPANTPGALAAKAATSTIPIVFGVPEDPVALGLVASLAQPGGNATGINFFANEIDTKRLGLMHELLPKAKRFAVLVNPGNPTTAATTANALKEAASGLGLELLFFNAGTPTEIDVAFAAIVQAKADALFVEAEGFLASRGAQLIALAARDRLPASDVTSEVARAGLLMSYGTSIPDVFRQTGIYTGSIIKGTKPTELPVLQSTKFEFILNLKTARALGIDVPPTLLARADEVIE